MNFKAKLINVTPMVLVQEIPKHYVSNFIINKKYS